MSSIFGQPTGTTTPAAGAAPTTGLFGQPAASAPATGLFGQPAAAPAAGAGLFGQPAAAPATGGGGLFGSSTTTAPTTGGGLFGASTTTQPATGGGLFGSTATTAPTTGGGLFGSTTTAPTQPAAGGGLFGSTATTSQPATGGGLFGASTTAPATGGGLFGASTAAPATGGGLFGASTTAAPATGGGLFGASTATPAATGGGLFGSTNTGLFGAKPAVPGLAPAATIPALGTSTTTPAPGGLFGQSTGLFGAAKPVTPAASSSLFGTTTGGTGLTQPTAPAPATTLGASLLSTSALRAPGAATGTGSNPAVDAQTQFARLNAKIEGIASAWNAQSPHCRFQHIFYNYVAPPQTPAMFGRPANMSDAMWTKAAKENPDPSCLIPTLAVGYEDLRLRVDGQTATSTQHATQLTELKKRIADLSLSQNTNHTRALQLAAAHVRLYQKLLGVVVHLHLLIPAVRGGAVRIEEENIRGMLEEIRADVGVGAAQGNGNGGSRAMAHAGRLRAKIAELWALVGALSAARDTSSNAQATGEWKVVDEEGLARIAQILSEQQAGLVHLTKILQKDLKDLAVVLGKSSVRPGEEGADDQQADMWRTARAGTMGVARR
ncbi:C2H2-type domain-containing protein [Mycena chlorophos]|uniref:C2H2-type domain-containing protein n=1 Tax=Mycena chlorophos TaxID=658473 RepID=A0A8H6RZ73_MYCCL|nr:C2H2-type domain-containing protein [Mycena chlorophos]